MRGTVVVDLSNANNSNFQKLLVGYRFAASILMLTHFNFSALLETVQNIVHIRQVFHESIVRNNSTIRERANSGRKKIQETWIRVKVGKAWMNQVPVAKMLRVTITVFKPLTLPVEILKANWPEQVGNTVSKAFNCYCWEQTEWSWPKGDEQLILLPSQSLCLSRFWRRTGQNESKTMWVEY